MYLLKSTGKNDMCEMCSKKIYVLFNLYFVYTHTHDLIIQKREHNYECETRE